MPRFAIVVRVSGEELFCVPLGLQPVTFGRRNPEAQIALRDPILTKRHFDVEWDAESECHDVIDFGRYSLTLNGTSIAGVPDRVPLKHPPSWRGDRRPLRPGDVLSIGDCELFYIAIPPA